MTQMHIFVLAIMLSVIAAPAQASESVFAGLVKATSTTNRQALVKILSIEKLSTSTGTVGKDNRKNGGKMRHGVAVTEIADKLSGCAVKQWRDTGSDQGKAYILWECPNKRVPQNDCYFYSYRAEMLDARYHPANLFVLAMPSRDYERCGHVLVPPPPLPSR